MKKNNQPLFKWAFILIFISLISACAAIPKPDLTNPVRTVVILPFSNLSNNVDAPNNIRTMLAEKLTAKFYKVVPIEQVDQTLMDQLGITLGEQIQEITLEEIASEVEADAYIYGDISYYDSVTAGIINTNRVAAKMRMIRAGSEIVLWNTNIGVKSESRSGGALGALVSLGSAISDASDEEIEWITIQSDEGGDGSILGNLVAGLVKSAISSAVGINLDLETRAFVAHSSISLRNGPGF